MRFRTVAAIAFCLALIVARALGLHFHESVEYGASSSAQVEVHDHVGSTLDHDELTLDHSVSHVVEGHGDVDVDWTAAAGQSMPKSAMTSFFILVAIALAFVPRLSQRVAFRPMRPPGLGLGTGLPPPNRGPPALS